MTGQELQALAASRNENPYFLGYALVTGAPTVDAAWERDGNGAGFLCWNGERWEEQAKREGRPRYTGDYKIGVSDASGAADRHCDLIAEHVTAAQREAA